MKGRIDRYFELLPIMIIVLIVMASEYRHQCIESKSFGLTSVEVQSPKVEFATPRLIFR